MNGRLERSHLTVVTPEPPQQPTSQAESSLERLERQAERLAARFPPHVEPPKLQVIQGLAGADTSE
jgi:hypothetical protein